MDEDQVKKLALVGEEKRQADAPFRGYFYQIWHSVLAWLDLKDDQLLFLEGAEDFDVVEPDIATAVQVKSSVEPITLRTPDIVQAINNYWSIRTKNPGRTILYRYLTRAQISKETGHPFGEGIAGLKLWEDSKKAGNGVRLLKEFLLSLEKLSPELKEFLSQAGDELIFEQLVRPIKWETESGDAGFIEADVKRKLVSHGNKYNIPFSESEKVANKL